MIHIFYSTFSLFVVNDTYFHTNILPDNHSHSICEIPDAGYQKNLPKNC